MERPRLLLVPTLTELEWQIRPLLEEWAEVVSYDVPGAGDEPPGEDPSVAETARRGLEHIARRGWNQCVVVGDEAGVEVAVEVAVQAPGAVQALALGHARLSDSTQGTRPALNPEVYSGYASLMRSNPRSWVRQIFRATGGEQMEGGLGEEIAEEYLRRVPPEVLLPYWEAHLLAGDFARELAALEMPMLLVQHRGCVLFTAEGFEEAVAALPGATTAVIDEKPSTCPEFARLLEAFCHEQVLLTA